MTNAQTKGAARHILGILGTLAAVFGFEHQAAEAMPLLNDIIGAGGTILTAGMTLWSIFAPEKKAS